MLEINDISIKEFREKHRLSQTEFAELTGLSLRTVQNYEGGKKIPNFQYAKLRKVMQERDDEHEQTNIPVKQEVFIASDLEVDTWYNKNGNKFIIKNDGNYEIEVVCLPFPAYASYLEVYMDEKQVQENFNTTTFKVDKIGKGYYMAFEIKGDSMNDGGINDTPDGASVLAREIKQHHWESGFKQEKYGYILMTKYNILHKDIVDYDSSTGLITLSSRNEHCEDFQISINDVYRLFNVIKRNF